MQFSRMSSRSRGLATSVPAAIALSAIVALAAEESRADSAYIAQVPGAAVTDFSVGGTQQPTQTYGSVTPSARPSSLPEGINPSRGGNYASNLQVGSRNGVLTLQAGANSVSTTGVIGNNNNLTVLQGGNNLRSNVVLLNGSNMNVSVIQPRGSAPVNVLIARLPGGGLLIKR